MKKIIFILLVVIIFFGGKACNDNTHYPSIYIYYNGKVQHLDYINLVGGSSGCGKNEFYSYTVQSSPYKGVFSDTNWDIYKEEIDSIVILERNFWTDGLPSKKEIKGGFYETKSGIKTIKIKIIDKTL